MRSHALGRSMHGRASRCRFITLAAPTATPARDTHLIAFLESSWHPIGTCKMGVDEMAVVDPQLRVQGVPGLRVADSSIMIGEKAADLVLAAHA